MNNIYVVRGTEQAGPFTEAEVRAQLAAGALTGDSMVWWEGLPEWTPISGTPLAGPALAGGASAAPIVPAPAPAPATLEPGVPGAAAPKTSAMAIVAFVSAIVGFFCIGIIGPILAIVFGHLARGQIKKEHPAYTGEGLALAALIIGYLALVIQVICLIFYFAVVGAAISQSIKNANAGMTFPVTNSAPAHPGQ